MPRLIREADWRTLQARLTALDAERVQLFRELTEQTARARSKSTMADLLTLRVNQLEVECADLKVQLTGRPQQVAQIAKASVAQNAMLDASASLFDDVGNEEAERLRQAHLLHDEFEEIEMPAAAELSADAIPR